MTRHFARASAIACALAFGIGAAAAADLPSKTAPAPTAKTSFANLVGPYTGSGLYIGANIGGGGGSASMINASTVNLQGLLGATIGYAWAMPGGTGFAALEGDFDVMNLSTGSNAGLTLSGPVDLEQRFLYGFPVQQFLQMVPAIGNLFASNPLPPFQALPAGVTATNAHMYVFAGVDEKDVSANLGLASNKAWLIAPELGIGNRVQLSNGFAMDTSLAVQLDSRGLCAGAGQCGNIGTSVIGKLKFLY